MLASRPEDPAHVLPRARAAGKVARRHRDCIESLKLADERRHHARVLEAEIGVLARISCQVVQGDDMVEPYP